MNEIKKKKAEIQLTCVLSLSLLLMAACQQEWGATPLTGEGEVHSLGIAALYAQGDASLTRAVDEPLADPALPTDAAVGFFVKADGTSYAEINNQKGNYNTDAAQWLPTDSIWLNNVTATLAVYAPYDATQLTSGKLNLKAMLRPADGSQDISSTSFEANSRTNITALNLKYRYSRICVTFVKDADADYTGTAALTKVVLSSTGIYTNATFNPLLDTYADYSTPGVTVSPVDVIIAGTDATDANATKVDLLLPPYTVLTEDVTLTATVDTKEMKITVPKAALANTLAAGKKYNLTIKLKPTALVLGGIKTTNWDEQPVFEGGDLEYPEEEIEPVQIGKYTWAGANLRTSDAGTTNFKFEKKPWISGVYPKEKLNGEVEAAKTNLCYWNWGCLKTPAKTKFLSGETTKWGDIEDGTQGDPCAKVAPAGTWQVPSTEQFNDLTNHLPAKGSSVSINGEVFEMTSESGWAENKALDVAGQVFVENDKAIFLPAAGYRDSAGAMYTVGTDGHYWSRTPASSYAYSLYFFSSGVTINTNARNNGYSVRCVQGTEAP